MIFCMVSHADVRPGYRVTIVIQRRQRGVVVGGWGDRGKERDSNDKDRQHDALEVE